MKYVMFKMLLGEKQLVQYMPVIFPEHVCHDQVKIEGAEVVSAGFCYTEGCDISIPNQKSTSLGIGPNKERDTLMLEDTLMDMGTMSFTELPD